MKKNMSHFQTRIKEFRARYDLTQNDLAIIIGVRRETIVHLERGSYNPSLKLASDLAWALNTTIDALFYFEPSDDQIDRVQHEITKIRSSKQKPEKKQRELDKWNGILSTQEEMIQFRNKSQFFR